MPRRCRGSTTPARTRTPPSPPPSCPTSTPTDPTQANGQFCDHGTQSRSAIFYGDTAEKRLAEASKHAIESTPQRFKGTIVTQIVPAGVFWPAEEYHQDFYKKDPERYQSYRLG